MSQSFIELEIALSGEQKDVLLALLSDYPFSGFQEEAGLLKAYISEADYQGEEKADILEILAEQGLEHKEQLLAASNWNASWESDYEPVEVGNFCRIRADFHESKAQDFRYELCIKPKMSFGTGHHPTTCMVVEAMRGQDFAGASLLDYGCGTGILGILAARMGAKQVLGLDIEPWAVENSRENAQSNGISEEQLLLLQGGLERLGTERFGFILANINRQVLLDSFAELWQRLEQGGLLICSGFFVQDQELLLAKTKALGFWALGQWQQGDWACLAFQKP